MDKDTRWVNFEQLLKQSKPNFTEINQKLNQNEPTLKEIEQKLKLLKVDSKSNESEKIVSVEFQLIASEMLKNQLSHDNGMGWDKLLNDLSMEASQVESESGRVSFGLRP